MYLLIHGRHPGKLTNSWKEPKPPHQITSPSKAKDVGGGRAPCSGYELRQTSGDSEGQEGLESFSPWGHKKLDMTVQCN